MADYTENYGFKKPLRTDRFDINDFNGNMDMIDAAIASSSSSGSSGQSAPAAAALSANAPASYAAAAAEYYSPPYWTYETGEGYAGTTLTVHARQKGLMIAAVRYCITDNGVTAAMAGEGWTMLHRSMALMNYFTCIAVFAKPVEAGSYEITITQENAGMPFYVHAFCLYGASSAEVVWDGGSSGASCTAEPGTPGKRRLCFTQQGETSSAKALTVEDLPDCGIIDSIYMATVWDICTAETTAPTFKYQSGPMGVLVMEVTMEG